MSNPFEREDLHAPLAEINMTPMVDIMLVLLVILLISAPIINSAINVNLPKEQASQFKNDKVITITINQAGEFFLEETKMPESDLEKHIAIIAKEHPEQKINLHADQNVAYKSVGKILAIMQKNSLNNISFITEN